MYSAEPAPLQAARTLFAELNAAGIRYGAFKSTRAIPDGVAGRQDLDILVARDDFARFCATLSRFGAVHSVAHPSLASVGREDWFVPDFERAAYLHLDVHTAVRLGGKFTKHLSFFQYDDISRWITTPSGLPAVSAEDEARITLSRIAFRQGGKPWQKWVRPTGDWKREIADLVFAPGAPDETEIVWPGGGLRVRLRRAGDGFEVRADDLRAIRREVRLRNFEFFGGVIADVMRDRLRMARYLATRAFNRLWPGHILDRRRPVGGGLVVAVIAPDGMGKSSQVERLTQIFKWKFSAFNEYMGTGDGKGWAPRRMVRAIYSKRKKRFKEELALTPVADRSRPEKRGLKRRVLSLALAVYGVVTAWERWTKVRRAHRAAARGFIVICDRWPQNLQVGVLDGPVPPVDPSLFPGISFLTGIERRIYDRIALTPPDLALHMTADHAVSASRKPGAIDRADFEARISLMQRLRVAQPTCSVVIDGSRDIDSVTADLFRAMWQKL